MPDREKAIRGMEAHYSEKPCSQCPYRGEERCTMELAADALALLKDQEPHVMTFEEIKDNMGVPVWVEYADNENWNGYGVPTSDYKAYIMIYGANAYCGQYARSCNVKWRAWTAKPSPEQMRDTKWEGESDASR